MSTTTSEGKITVEDLHDLLSFDHDVQGMPTTHSPIIRDEEDVLIYADRSRNAGGEWEVRGYRVLGDGIAFHPTDSDRASVAAMLIETFDPDDMTVDDRYTSQRPISDGIPVAVAVDGKPAVVAWLYVAGVPKGEIAEMMAVGHRTVIEYLSRFRRDRVGIPNDVDAPKVGSILPEIPPPLRPGGSG